MFKVVICDDDLNQIELNESYALKFAKSRNIGVEFEKYNDSGALVKDIKSGNKEVDIFLLDIEMPNMDGMELGRILRKKYENSIIIYITGFKKYAFDAFEVRAFDYLMKPITYEKFEKAFENVFSRIEELKYKQDKQKEFTIETKQEVLKVNYDEIYYFEKFLRKVRLVYSSGEIEYYNSFKKLMEELDMSKFVQCHQSFIVSIDKITNYKNQEIFIEDLNEYIPVSKGSIKKVKNALAENIF